MITEYERQAIVDDEHLRLLPVFYWVLGGLDILFSLYGVMYMFMGVLMALVPMDSADPAAAPPAFMGWIFFAIGGGMTAIFVVNAVLKVLTGFWIRGRKHRAACLVVAGITCVSIPFGTVCGVFSFIVLLRPSVAWRFAGGAPVAPVLPAPVAPPAPPMEQPTPPLVQPEAPAAGPGDAT